VKITAYQGGAAQVHQHHVKRVEVTRFSAETHAFCRGRSDRFEIALEKTVECTSLEEGERRGAVIKTRGREFSLIEQVPGRRAITGHALGDRC
jgi:hypothetical protein